MLPNSDGGNDNRDAAAFLKRVNELVYAAHPGAFTIAEESTSWPGVSAPTSAGGLGFGFKWNLGFMHDTLAYMALDPVHRKWHHDRLTFGLTYAFSENFVLPLSHDEVVHGKRSLIGKMPGDDWRKFANLRAYYGFMWAHPGKKLLFMGQEFAQRREWNDDRELSVAAFARYGSERDQPVVMVANFTPVPRHGYRIGLPRPGQWREILNTDALIYGGAGARQLRGGSRGGG